VASISWWSRSRLALHDLVKAARQFEPELWRNFQRELSPSRHWADRAVVLTYAIVTGLVVATHAFASMSRMHPLAPYAALACCGGHVAASCRVPRDRAFRRWCVRSTTDLSPSRRAGWCRCACRCTRSGWCRAAAGGPVDRARGPDRPGRRRRDGQHARAGCRRSSGIDAHDLMVAGAAAGIAAAFNTPLGGIVFALEQLTRRRHISHSSLVIACIVLAGLVAVAVFGNETYFGAARAGGVVVAVGPDCWWPWWPAGGRAVLAPDRGLGARPARPLQPLAQRLPAAFRRRLCAWPSR
jgi:hypothetical protein